MPFLAPLAAFLAANAGAIGAGASIAGAGTSIGEAIANSGGPPKPGALPGPTPPTAGQLQTERGLVSQQLPNVIGATSGLANPEYASLMAQILAGTLGQPGSTAAGNAATGQNSSSFTPTGTNQATNAAIQGSPIQL